MDTELKETIGARLRSFRKNMRKNQYEFVEKIPDLGQPHLSGIENGRSSFSITTLHHLVKVYKINPLWLLFGEGVPQMNENDIITKNDDKLKKENALLTEQNKDLMNKLLATQDELIKCMKK